MNALVGLLGQPVRKGNMDEKHKGECRTCWLLCCALAQMCAADPATVVDQLTGYLWDEEEAGEIKANAKADAPEKAQEETV